LSTEEHWRLLERAYASAPINAFYRPRLEVRDGAATVEIDVRPEHHHAAGAMHGSVYFKMLDDAAFFAANSVVEDYYLVTVSFTVQLFRPVVAGRICARGHLLHATRRLLFAEAVLLDEAGAELARGSGTFARSANRLDERVGSR